MTQVDLKTTYTLEQMVGAVEQALDGADLVFGHGTEDALQEAYWLVLSACNEALGQEDYEWDRVLPANQVAAVELLLSQRISTRKPLAYLLKEAWFAGLQFYIDERALVPRSFMAEWIPDRFAPWVESRKVKRVLDLCCGSGCIGIAAAMAFPLAKVVLSDLSSEALQVAEKNIQLYGLANRAAVNQGKMFDGIEGKFDLILCNPPYVSLERMRKLPEEFLAEPALALEAGEDGLDFLRPFLAGVRKILQDDGVLIVEAGSAGPVLEEAYPHVPFTWLGTEHDEMVLFYLDAEGLDHSADLLKQFNEQTI